MFDQLVLPLHALENGCWNVFCCSLTIQKLLAAFFLLVQEALLMLFKDVCINASVCIHFHVRVFGKELKIADLSRLTSNLRIMCKTCNEHV